MPAELPAAPVSTAALWTGRILGAVVALFLLSAAVMDLVKPPFVMEGMVKYGYPVGAVGPIGAALLLGVVLYALPRTSVLGAIVLTGYLGGAVSTHVRAADPIGRMLVPVVFAALAWGALYLRDGRLRTLLPLRRP